MIKKLSVIASAIVLASCASTSDEPKNDSQENEQAVSTADFLDLTGADNDKSVRDYWVIDKRVEPQYPPMAAKSGISGCVDFTVGIGADGSVAGFRVNSSYPKGVFDHNASAALLKWKWQAAPNTEGTPVLTKVQLDFRVSDSKNDAEFEANCQIKG